MAYNPYSAVNAIYKLKGQWDTANNANDTTKKNDIAAKAQAYYNQLRNNSYGDIADELAASNYTQAKVINDKWAKMDKTPTRDYMYSLGKSRGMSATDVDKLISWDNQTGEVSFGGKKIGTPDTVVDGVSYWADTSVLDNAFNDYVSRSGAIRAKSASVDQENEKLFAKYNQEYEDLKKTNPFETDEAKSILAKYDLAGLQGRDNAVASGAGSNGGNIDSFAAANALRQQSALVNQGQQVVLDAHQRKLDHARALLSDMGVNIDRVFNQDETTKNNDVSRKSEIASVSGYTPTEWSIQNDAFLKNFVDENGKLKSEYNNTDFQELINNAKASGNNELANKYAILRGLKIFGNFSEYGKYLNQGDVAYTTPQRTADYDLTKQQIDSAERISKANNDASLASINAQLASNENIAKINAENAAELAMMEAGNAKELAQIERQNALDLAGIEGQNKLDPITASGQSGSGQSPEAKTTANGGSSNNQRPLSESAVKSWVNYLNKGISDKYGEKYKALKETGKNQYERADADADYIIIRVFGSNDLTQEQKEYLLYDKFGITLDQVNAAMKDLHYR